MKVKRKESRFVPIDVTFKVKIETEEEYKEIREYAEGPISTWKKGLVKSNKTGLNILGKLLHDFCMGVIKNHHGK